MKEVLKHGIHDRGSISEVRRTCISWAQGFQVAAGVVRLVIDGGLMASEPLLCILEVCRSDLPS